ncbi:MAG: hypothetical protein K8R87_11730 [Verrucomicrobia bacterium]|nr:hypothetical protein [Verrucomicrobiota bacterium]
MKIFLTLCLGFVAQAVALLPAEELLDRVDQALTFSTKDGGLRARLSGLIDLETYNFSQPAPALIYSDQNFLLNPRLTLFFDAQLGSKFYLFIQSCLDRGFDPSDGNAQVRLDEYALRFTPWDDGRLNLQIGKFATVVGTWQARHHSWENPFISAPLVYENLTAIYDMEVYASSKDLLTGVTAEKYEFLPVIWGADYATGASVSGRLGQFEYAAEIKNTPPSARPESWDGTSIGFQHPTVSARVAWRPDPRWNLGVSASEGSYFRSEAAPMLPAGRNIGDYHQTLLGQDISFAWHHWQLWAELYESRFEVPNVGNVDTFAYYLEAKYKFTPQLFGALRWNQQLFSNVDNGEGGSSAWGNDVWRLDAAVGCRPTAHTQLKLQYSVQHGNYASRSEISHLIATQFTLRF